ncbi:MAG: hypothetical protein WAX69_03715 [Victivallales bacterium]
MQKTEQLRFDEITPVAPHGLGGLVRDHFSNGRIFATVGAHGGLLGASYWGNQHLGAKDFFKGDAESAWVKLFRVCVRIGEKRYYLTLNDTRLYPFGYGSHCEIDGVEFSHELLLLPDALVQRARVIRNPRRLPVQFDMVHQEACTAISRANRTWEEFAFQPKENALIVSCLDENPEVAPGVDDSGLAQKGLKHEQRDAPKATTWIGIGCDAPLKVRRGYHRRSKYYLDSKPIKGKDVAYYVVFATERKQLTKRLAELSRSVHRECDQLLSGYEKRLLARPRIDVGDPVLSSAFGQYPEVIESMKLPDRPGAVRGTAAGYFVWGWDGMTPMVPCALANEPEYTAETLRFFQESLHPVYGIPHAYTSQFGLALKGPFPAQCQYIASLYHYVSTTGDLSVAKEVMPTCKFILDRCRRDEIRHTGLVSGNALWPDFPEAMEEDGNDVSSLNNSFLYQALRGMEFLADALGDAKLACECRDWAQRLRVSFVNYLYDEEKGYFISSCSSKTLKPRKHYCCQAIFWITPFARELVSHAPGRISEFMDKHLRSDKCLLSLPHWDTAWMADGNQLGSSYPTADYFYLNVHKLVGDDYGLKAWTGDVDWFWRHHTAPEAFTPEAENEAELGPDNPGCKQLQAVTSWYAGLYMGLAGMDFDHEGLTLTPWGDKSISILGLKLHGVAVDLKISGRGNHVGSLKLNGKALPAGSRKIAWSAFKGRTAKLELIRSEKAPSHPVIVRADGLRVIALDTAPGCLSAQIAGEMSGEVVIQAKSAARVSVDGKRVKCLYDHSTRCFIIPFDGKKTMEVSVKQR